LGRVNGKIIPNMAPSKRDISVFKITIAHFGLKILKLKNYLKTKRLRRVIFSKNKTL
jgi:hypothetical protein